MHSELHLLCTKEHNRSADSSLFANSNQIRVMSVQLHTHLLSIVDLIKDKIVGNSIHAQRQADELSGCMFAPLTIVHL